MTQGLSPGRLVLPAIRWRADGGFDPEREGVSRALEAGVGGFIVFGGTLESVNALTTRLHREAGRPLLIGSDLERGAGQQVVGLSEYPPPRALASLEDPEVIQEAARTTAGEARSVGINWVFAPDADLDCEPANPIVQSRSFGADPDRVARAVALWVKSCQDAGALACVKHFPGHGRTVSDSHAELPVVAASRQTLIATDELPFRAGIEAGVASVMTAHVAYPALDPTGTPATFSPVIINRLRQDLSFKGLVVTDAMIMEGARRGASEASGAVEIIRAGVDLLLYPQDPIAIIRALEQSEAAGELPGGRLRESLDRYEHALAQATRPAPAVASGRSETIADRLLALGVARGEVGDLRSPFTCEVIDDDIGGPYPPVPGPTVPAELAREMREGVGGSRIILVYSEPRGWKGRAGLSPASREALTRSAPGADLIILFGHPRLVREIPGPAPVLVAWHRQALMQRAVVRWLGKVADG